MEENTQAKIEYITSGDLAEQTKIILGAMDNRIDKLETKIDIRFNNVSARFDELETELKTEINSVQTLIDGYVKAQEDFKQEFVIMKEEVRLMKQIFKEKFGVEIRAV
jgi:phage host-nuclease inhibitor protein Gam